VHTQVLNDLLPIVEIRERNPEVAGDAVSQHNSNNDWPTTDW
jgi:hypothetical protein